MNARFAPAGVTGIAVIISYLLGLPIGRMALLFNIPIIIIISYPGQKIHYKINKNHADMCICYGLHYPVSSDIYGEIHSTRPYAQEFFRVGLTLIYLRGSSAGGTDFLIMASRRLYPHLSIGQITWIIDMALLF